MIVYVVCGGEYDEKHVDSVWSTWEAAEQRKAAYDREHGRWRSPFAPFSISWREDMGPTAKCVADGAWIEQYEVDAARAEGAPR